MLLYSNLPQSDIELFLLLCSSILLIFWMLKTFLPNLYLTKKEKAFCINYNHNHKTT